MPNKNSGKKTDDLKIFSVVLLKITLILSEYKCYKTTRPQEWITLIFSHTVTNSRRKKKGYLKYFGLAWSKLHLTKQNVVEFLNWLLYYQQGISKISWIVIQRRLYLKLVLKIFVGLNTFWAKYGKKWAHSIKLWDTILLNLSLCYFKCGGAL